MEIRLDVLRTAGGARLPLLPGTQALLRLLLLLSKALWSHCSLKRGQVVLVLQAGLQDAGRDAEDAGRAAEDAGRAAEDAVEGSVVLTGLWYLCRGGGLDLLWLLCTCCCSAATAVARCCDQLLHCLHEQVIGVPGQVGAASFDGCQHLLPLVTNASFSLATSPFLHWRSKYLHLA